MVIPQNETEANKSLDFTLDRGGLRSPESVLWEVAHPSPPLSFELAWLAAANCPGGRWGSGLHGNGRITWREGRRWRPAPPARNIPCPRAHGRVGVLPPSRGNAVRETMRPTRGGGGTPPPPCPTATNVYVIFHPNYPGPVGHGVGRYGISISVVCALPPAAKGFDALGVQGRGGQGAGGGSLPHGQLRRTDPVGRKSRLSKNSRGLHGFEAFVFVIAFTVASLVYLFCECGLVVCF